MNHDPRQHAIDEHKRWMSYLQPEGVVVSAVALVDHSVQLDASAFNATQENFLAIVSQQPETGAPFIPPFAQFARTFLGWRDDLLAIFAVEAEVPDALRVSTGEFGELLYPDAALRHLAPADPAKPWLLLIRQLAPGTNFDAVPETDRGWQASPAQKFERLLRWTAVPIGIISNGTEIRLIYAPRGENAGSLTFPVRFMTELPGRAVTAAMEMLLSHRRLISVSEASRLPSLLKKSREYQSAVSTQLAEQVLEALYELVRGFQAADQQVGGKLLRDVLARNPDEVYHGLLNVLLRLVFLLFTEDRSLMPVSRLYQNNYSVHGLFERLKAANERYPDTMDSRHAAWAQLLTLFRLVHGGCKHPELTTPARSGNLFDFERFPFLEGRVPALAAESGVILPGRDRGELTHLPVVSDGIIYRVLEKLLILDGERLSYRALDVEEIGSVYQTIMGFCVEVSTGNAIALKGKRKNGGVPAAPVINLDHLLAVATKDRTKWLKENADTDLNGDADKKVKAAATVMDLLAALDKRIDRQSTPMPVQPGGLFLQPTDERRRSGSHYTPRTFTRPIVQKTLEPILARLGRHPKPEEILALKICDIAVGSAAFLVEACRQLADELIAAWHFHKCLPVLPPDEDEVLHAMRTIAQRCLYGVDRNPMAVDLAKLSLWLATLAKDHPFTFVDHAIRYGDSLVGLTRRQIETFSWKSEFTTGQLWEQDVRKRTAAALRERQNLLGMGDDYGIPQLKRALLEKADELLDYVRFIGDAAICAFFSADKDKAREARRQEFIERISDKDFSRRPIAEVKALRGERPSFTGVGEGACRANEDSGASSHQHPVLPFHWEIEFPEVFDRDNPGFDAIVGNPPFLGGKRISTVSGNNYRDWLAVIHAESNSNLDLVAHFFRAAFMRLRLNGCFGLIATNTIGQGDTRATGLRWICTQSGTIYAARKRYKWPGQAAVVVSVIWVAKAQLLGPFELEGKFVPEITAYLFHTGGNDNPSTLLKSRSRSFIGSYVMGMGFLFDDHDDTGETTPISEMRRLIAANPINGEVIFPYISGGDLNDSPTHAHHRYVINFGDRTLGEAHHWSELMAIIERKVKPYRDTLKRDAYRNRWWQFGEKQSALYSAIGEQRSVLACSLVSTHLAWGFVNAETVFAHKLCVVPFDNFEFFTVLQTRPHEVWSRFVSSTLGDALNYSPTDCFETFPFPTGFEANAALEAAGREYYEFRAALMVRHNEGLTKTYNRFHDPEESDPDIHQLRQLHAQMDAAVLTAYGWTNLLPKCTCEFLLDYEDEVSDAGLATIAEESTGRKKEKAVALPLADEVRDEVLARLLKLNAERAKEEELAGKTAGTQKPKLKKTAKKAGVSKEQIGLPLQPRATQPRKHSRGINFKRGAIASYAVNRLCDRPEFGRIQMEKVFYGAQCIIGIDLEMDFKPFENGPFDKEIHKIESLANKQQWFHSVPRQGGIGTAYRRGDQITDRCGAAKSILGDKLVKFERILDWMGRMDSERAGIWTTVHFVWNELILAGKPVTDDAIVKGFYEFHEAKKSIEEKRVRACIQWLRDNNFVPKGILFQSAQSNSAEQELSLDFSAPAPQPVSAPEPEPLIYTINLAVALLSEAGGSLAWPRLLNAFVLATDPKLMKRYALPDLKKEVQTWAAQSHPLVPEGGLIPSLNQLGAKNLTVTQGNDGPVFHLLDGPRPSATNEISTTAKLALRIAETLTPDAVQIPDRAKMTKEVNKLVLV